jgi:hypothetical protein
LIRAPCVFGLSLLLSNVFDSSPLHFDDASFSSGVFNWSPLRFGVAFIFIGGL